MTKTIITGQPKKRIIAVSMPREFVTSEMIAKKAYELSQANPEDTELDNWLQAEKELRSSYPTNKIK